MDGWIPLIRQSKERARERECDWWCVWTPLFDDDDFSIQNTNVPLLKSMFDVRAAVEQRLAIESYLHYAEAMKTRQQFAFTWKLFEMEQQENPSLPPQQQQQRK